VIEAINVAQSSTCRGRPDRPDSDERTWCSGGVGTPAIDALIGIVRSMTGKDFAVEGRTLERLGLGGMDAPQIRRVMEEGFS
jgi:hypothetical protein